MQPNPPPSGAPHSPSGFAFFRDHPGWGAVGAIAAISAVGVAVAHDFFGFRVTKEPAVASPADAPAGAGGFTAPASANPTSARGSAEQSSTEQTSLPKSSCLRQVAVTAPGNGVRVRGEEGVRLRGTACGLLSGDRGWVFEFDPFDGYYYSAEAPAFVRNGPWSYVHQPVGDEGDKSKYYKLQVVLASAECNDFLARFPVNDEGDKRLSRSDFPEGCVFADAVNIAVTWPVPSTSR